MAILTDLLGAEARRRILEKYEDLVAPLPGIVVEALPFPNDPSPARPPTRPDIQLGQRTPKPKPARGRGRRGRPPRGGGRRGRPTPVATRPDLQPGERAPAPQPVRNPNPRATGSTSFNQPVPLRPDLQPGQRPPQPPAETPEQGFLGAGTNYFMGSAMRLAEQTGADITPPQPRYDVGDIQGFGEPPPSQFAPHPLEGLGVQDIFETGTLDMKQQLLEDIRDWEDVVYGGQRQNPYTGTLMRYYQDPRYEYASEPQSKKDADAREFAAWEEDFGPFPLTTEKQLWWGEETGLLEWPEDLDLPDLGLTDYPEGYGGYGEGYGGFPPGYVPPGYAARSPYTPNRRQGYVGLVSWRI